MSERAEKWLLEFARTKDGPLTPFGDRLAMQGFDAGYSEGARSQHELMDCKHPKACWVEKRTEPTCKSVGERYDETYAGHYCTACAELADLRESERKLREALEKIDMIRNSIVAYQNVNWSAHIYPLVAALKEAGFEGMGYEKAREHFKLAPPAPAKAGDSGYGRSRSMDKRLAAQGKPKGGEEVKS